MMASNENPCFVRGLGEKRSAYFELREARREVAKARAHERYHARTGEHQRRNQYRKAFRCGLVRPPGAALARHGIVFVNGEYVLASEMSTVSPSCETAVKGAANL